ncbi:DNA starvation/stationary phase protection protein Dps [Congregibacter litoralis]
MARSLKTVYVASIRRTRSKRSKNMSTNAKFTVPGLNEKEADAAVQALDGRMVALIDLALTLKHIHWNVVGPNFIGVHEMLDPQVEAVNGMVDNLAERIATLGGVPVGTPGSIAERRNWSDYSIGKGLVTEHLGALDLVYSGVNEGHRDAIAKAAKVDPVSEDMLIAQLADLELFQWFVRAHLESSDGKLATVGASTEEEAAKKAANQ